MRTHPALSSDEKRRFRNWWRSYQRSLFRTRGSDDALLPTYYVSAPDFVRQFDMLNHLKPCSYDWNPSPITHETSPAIRARLETVTVEECHE